MSPNKTHTQHSTSRPIFHNIAKPNICLCRVRTSIWEPPHHPQFEKAYLNPATQKTPFTSTLIPSAPIPTIYLVPLYLLLLLLSILSAILINYLITLESCNTLVK
jgi:hypothetical protein